mmetsp:Transcript_60524/g.144218  ORF Transcript_60524/g.144218 Transcript_60524/m.144218 type:complete len:90 (+) Transcript_60524:562-831(+)
MWMDCSDLDAEIQEADVTSVVFWVDRMEQICLTVSALDGHFRVEFLETPDFQLPTPPRRTPSRDACTERMCKGPWRRTSCPSVRLALPH